MLSDLPRLFLVRHGNTKGRFFFCQPASVGVLAFEYNNRAAPIVALWNYLCPREERGATAVNLTEALP